MEHFRTLGRLGLASRLKRLSDAMMADVNALYEEEGIELEASCFPLLTLLEARGPLNMREAEALLGTSQAYVSQKAKALAERGLISVETDASDARSRIMCVSERGLKLIARARPIWLAIDRATADLLHPNEESFFRALQRFEAQVASLTLKGATRQHMADGRADDAEIIGYRPELRADFERLNREWLEKHYSVERLDEEMFADPESVLIRPGGAVLFARIGDAIVGTCALAAREGGFELCKMGVDPRYRGRGVGGKLVAAAIEEARRRKAERLYLMTGKSLKAAHTVYRRAGFNEVPLTAEDRQRYKRAEMRMEYDLRAT